MSISSLTIRLNFLDNYNLSPLHSPPPPPPQQTFLFLCKLLLPFPPNPLSFFNFLNNYYYNNIYFIYFREKKSKQNMWGNKFSNIKRKKDTSQSLFIYLFIFKYFIVRTVCKLCCIVNYCHGPHGLHVVRCYTHRCT